MNPLYLTPSELATLRTRVSEADLAAYKYEEETGTKYESDKEIAVRKLLFEREAPESCRAVLKELSPNMLKNKPEVLGEKLGSLSETDLYHIVFSIGAVGLRALLLTLLPFATKDTLAELAYMAYMRHELLLTNND